MSDLKVFVSSVSSGLEAHRQQIIVALRNISSLKVMGMELFGMRSAPPLETCLSEIRNSDVFFGIVGPGYGSRPERPNHKYSYTEHEYNEARRIGIPCLMVVLPDDFVPATGAPTVTPIKLDQDSLDSFRRKVRREHTVIEAKDLLTPEGLSQAYVTALHNLALLERLKDLSRPNRVPITALYYDLTEFGEIALSPADLQKLHASIANSLRLPNLRTQVRPHISGQGKSRRIVIESDSKSTVVFLARRAKKTVDSFALDRRCDVRFVATFCQAHRMIFRDEPGRDFVDYSALALDHAMSRLTQLKGGTVEVLGDDSRDIRALEQQGFFRSAKIQSTIEWEPVVAETMLWKYQRVWNPPEAFDLRPGKTVLEKLGSPLASGDKADELRYHRPPRSYGKLRNVLLDPKQRLVILVGRPGIGKSLCGLRLVAELMERDGRTPLLPRIATGVWKTLNQRKLEKYVVFLDDAFGKSFVRRQSELLDAKAELREFLKLDKDSGNAGGDTFGQKPLVIVTVRPNIWAHVKSAWGDDELVERVESAARGCVFVFSGEPYRSEDYVALFDDLYRITPPEAKSEHGYNPVDLSRVVSKFQHPMDVRDLFDELKQGRYFESGGRNKTLRDDILVRYNGRPDDRYGRDLQDSGPTQFCYFFCLRTFGSGLIPSGELMRIFHGLTTSTVGRPIDTHWKEFADRNERWGRWSPIGHFVPSHPLREEALYNFFSSAAAEPRLDTIFERLAALCESAPASDMIWQAAAYAAPQIGRTVSVLQKRLIELIVTKEDGQHARITLANSISYKLGMHYDQRCRHEEEHEGLDSSDARYLLSPETELALCETLRKLLHSDVMGAAGASVCDSYRSANGKFFGPPLEAAICRLAADEAGAEHSDPDAAREFKSQLAWAIAANFDNLPQALRNLLIDLAADTDEWIRLRCDEAIIDYYGALQKDKQYAGKFNKILEAIPRDPSTLVRRGIAASLDAHLGEIRMDSSSERGGWTLLFDLWDSHPLNLDTMEWVIWTCGTQLSEMLRLHETATIHAFRSWTHHPNSRVRRWAATALKDSTAVLDAEETATETRNSLSGFLARLADDQNEHVCNEAAKAFVESDGEIS